MDFRHKYKNTFQFSKPIAAMIGAAVIMLAGCTETGNIAVPDGAVEQLGHLNINQILPRSGPKAFLMTFDRYCTPYIGAPSKTRAALVRDGYVKLIVMDSGRASSYAHPDSKPMVTIGTTDNTKSLCLVMSRKNPALAPAVDTYLKRRFGAGLVDMSDAMPATTDQDNMRGWIAQASNRSLIYVSVLKTEPQIGPLYGFGVGLAPR